MNLDIRGPGLVGGTRARVVALALCAVACSATEPAESAPSGSDASVGNGGHGGGGSDGGAHASRAGATNAPTAGASAGRSGHGGSAPAIGGGPAIDGGTRKPTSPDAGPSAAPAQCTVGAHVADCCARVEARARADADADPCWFDWSAAQGPDPSFRWIQCMGGLTDCGSVQCARPEPPSRVAAPSQDHGGACAFADECSTDADCMLAIDASAHCPCPVSTPRALVAEHPCLLSANTPSSAFPELCDADRFEGSCGQCAPVPSVSCTREGDLRLCR